MFQPSRLLHPDNPILKRIAHPVIGPTPRQLLKLVVWTTVGAFVLFLTFYLFGGLTPLLTILQIAALPTAFILFNAIALASTIITVREIQGEAFELLKLTNIANIKMVWGLSGGILYRLRRTILAFIVAFIFAVLPIVLRIREIDTDGRFPTSSRPPPYFYFDPSLFELPFLMFLILIAAIGIVVMLVTSAVLTALRFRSVGSAASITLTILVMALIAGFLLWLILVSLAGGAFSMILALVAVPIPYIVGIIFSRRWQTDQLRLVAVTAHAPVAVIIFVLFTAILGFGLGHADQSDTILFWAMNAIFSFFLILSILSEWGLPSCPELIALLTWQILLVVMLAIGELSGSDVGFQAVVWMVSNALVITPYAVSIGNIERACRWVWRDVE